MLTLESVYFNTLKINFATIKYNFRYNQTLQYFVTCPKFAKGWKLHYGVMDWALIFRNNIYDKCWPDINF